MHRPGYCLERSGTEVSPPACTLKPFQSLASWVELTAAHQLVELRVTGWAEGARFAWSVALGRIRHADRWFRERERGFQPVCMQNVYLMSYLISLLSTINR